MNDQDQLKQALIDAMSETDAAKRRFAEVTKPEQAIEEYRRSFAAESMRRQTEQQTVRLQWEREAQERSAEKRLREAEYIEQQRAVTQAAQALDKAQRVERRADKAYRTGKI